MAAVTQPLKDRLKSLARTDIVKVFSLTSVSTLVKMCTGLVSIKVVALIIGPAGVALLGQLNNFVAIVLSFAGGGINNGVTKYTASYRSSPYTLAGYLSTGLRLTVVFGLLLGLLLVIFGEPLSRAVLLSTGYSFVFRLFGLTLLLYAANNFILSVVNGFKEFRRFVIINIAGSIVGLLFTVGLVIMSGLRGALAAVVTYQSVVLVITLWAVRKAPWLKAANFALRFDRHIAARYLRYSLMALVSAMMLPVAQLLLRGYMMSEISDTAAGWWEGMCRISNVYLMVVTTSFGVYYLPRLSEITDSRELRAEILKAFRLIAPLLLAGFAAIYFARYFIVRLLFSEAFEPMTGLFAWQMAGDFLKISSWLVAFVMIAKAYTRLYITTEILSTLTYIALGYWLIHVNGYIGAVQAHFGQYLLYSIAIVLIFYKLLFTPSKVKL